MGILKKIFSREEDDKKSLEELGKALSNLKPEEEEENVRFLYQELQKPDAKVRVWLIED